MKHILVTIPVEERHKKLLEAKAPGCEFFYQAPENVTDALLENAEIIIGNLPTGRLQKAKKLEWLQLNSAGADNYTRPGVLASGVKLTNATGAYGLAISEHMLASVLMLMKKLHLYHVNQLSSKWKDEGSVTSIYGSTTLVLGFGDIGQEFARRMKVLGSYVIGVRRNVSRKPDFADELYTIEDLTKVLPRADIIAMSLPNTSATYHLINREALACIKPGAILLNVGRGTSIDQEALYEALVSGRLGGAAVDVTDPEPLPQDSPLWHAPNMLITPHISGQYHLQETFERIVRIAAANLEHFMNQEELENQVDFETGYRKFRG